MGYDRSSFLAAYRPSWPLPLPEEPESSSSPSLCASTVSDALVSAEIETIASIFVADSSAESKCELASTLLPSDTSVSPEENASAASLRLVSTCTRASGERRASNRPRNFLAASIRARSEEHTSELQ